MFLVRSMGILYIESPKWNMKWSEILVPIPYQIKTFVPQPLGSSLSMLYNARFAVQLAGSRRLLGVNCSIILDALRALLTIKKVI